MLSKKLIRKAYWIGFLSVFDLSGNATRRRLKKLMDKFPDYE